MGASGQAAPTASFSTHPFQYIQQCLDPASPNYRFRVSVARGCSMMMDSTFSTMPCPEGWCRMPRRVLPLYPIGCGRR